MPPASSTAFHVMPKSARLIFVVADAPIRTLPHGSLCSGVGPSTARTTSRVVPRIVRSPVTSRLEPVVRRALFDTNVMLGWFSTSKKSALRRCVSRCASRVLMDPTSMVASIWSVSGRERSPFTAPDSFWNSPRTFDTIM